MKYIPNAMKFSTESRSSLLILNIEMCSNFYEIGYLVQMEHANYEYGTWNWWSWPKIID